MAKIKHPKLGLAPLDLRAQDHYEEMLTVDEVANLSGFSKQFIYRLTKSNSLRYCSLGGVTHIKYRHLRAWFVKLTSNKDCPLCPASFSLAGLMNYMKMGHCWVLRFVERYNVRSYYLGNSRRFNFEDCLATWAAEQTANSQWITIEKAIEEYAIESDVLLSVTACKQIRITDNSGKQVRYEFLDLEKYTTPANESQQNFNKNIDDIADAIRCERYISHVHKDYEFLSKSRINEDFLEYFHRNIMYRGIKFKVSLKYLHRFCKGKCSFKDVTVSFCERFKGFLTNNSKKRSYLDIIIHKTQAAVKLPLSPAAIELLGKPKKKGCVVWH